ncbi:hypothetical protein [Thalassoroseus pseudoceratinae]|uniref:hypothetical protein n=1 Tax=Thalassoroseus pseudoceratinae TaxID=2713176 RepID=UPI001420665B|nr:hypothetical protein [Thalassoroseus pseudoceratinae]
MDEKRVNVVIQPDEAVMRVDGYWSRHYATDFLAAADAFAPPKNRFSPIPYYLVCHSIELSFKAFLRSVGFNRNDCKKLNHNLEKALEIAVEQGLGNYLEVSCGDREVLALANRLYLKKEFEYFESLETIYDPHNFDIDELTEFARRLLGAIEDPVRASVFQ